ncbi:ApoD3 [Ramazzottius varieornatus]|uniref:Apolipoprotein D n=1 Tax=Ramazzottius varieornatus TaxID=947166 RepID=A0A1D1UYH8_RAMVA|nr:ApoD3 [Ramazzottius varieornatus]
MSATRKVFCTLMVAAILIELCDCQIVLYGSCDKQKVTAKKDFKMEQYVGRWYEQERYFMSSELGLVCVIAEYTMMPGKDSIQVNNSGVQSSTSEVVTVIGRGYAPDPAQPAKLLIEFSGGEPAGPLWIIETDYTDYAVAYACTDVGPYRLVASWLLSRQPKGFSHQSMEAIERVLRSNGILKEPFEHVDQTACPQKVTQLAELENP